MKQLFHEFGSLVFFALLATAVAGPAQAETFQYVYDETGQLIKAIDSTGTVIEYVYDEVGNILEIRRSTVIGLAIFNFTPKQGTVGTKVTIQGQNFSTTPLDNIVEFDGTPATVISATSNVLEANVPADATTGPITVTVGAETATSEGIFTVGLPASCLEIQQLDLANGDGRYTVELASGTFEVHCDFSADSGGWTRVGALDTSAGFCGNGTITDLRVDPDASMGKMPDSDAQGLMTRTAGSPMQVMYFSTADGRYVWHDLQLVTDFDTASKHTSSSFYCTNWHCDDGSLDASTCGGEGEGCPVTAHGIGGSGNKIYVDSEFALHIRGMHVFGSMCGLPNYLRAAIWIYVR